MEIFPGGKTQARGENFPPGASVEKSLLMSDAERLQGQGYILELPKLDDDVESESALSPNSQGFVRSNASSRKMPSKYDSVRDQIS